MITLKRLILLLGFSLLLSGCSAPSQDTNTELLSLSDLNTDKVTLIAIGNSDVPVGRYAQEILENLEIWDDMQGKISYASNVKEVLTQVALGSVTCGIVYATDAVTSEDVLVVEKIDSSLLSSPVIYPGALLSASTHTTEAELFLSYLTNDTSRQIFEDNGFTVIDTDNEWSSDIAYEACTLTLFAAASLMESVSAISEAFMAEYPGIEIIASYDSSGTLATQIEYGATADIFISASTAEVTELIALDYITVENVVNLLENELVLITQNGGASN